MPRDATSSIDQQIVAGLRRGDRQAFDRFLAAYASRLTTFAARRSSLDAAAIEDIVQITLIKALRGLAGYRGDSAFFTWLCQICRHQLADLARKSARQPRIDSIDEIKVSHGRDLPQSLIDLHEPLDECAADATCRSVRRAINRLPAQHSRLLELRFGDDLTLREVAALLGITERAAESRLVRAKQAFREEWADSAG